MKKAGAVIVTILAFLWTLSLPTFVSAQCDSCDNNADCTIDQTCTNGCCEQIPCTTNTDCPFPCITPSQIFNPAALCNNCIDGYCLDPCVTSAECGDRICASPSQNVECFGPEESNPDDCNCKDCLPGVLPTQNGNPCGNCINPQLTCTTDADCAAVSDFWDQCKNPPGICVVGSTGVEQEFCNSENNNCIQPPMDADTSQCFCTQDSDCADGSFCNGAETCSSGSCQAGTPPNCNDAISCTIDACNEGTDMCDHTPNNGACEDGLICNGTEICDPQTGCQPGVSTICNDGLSCTIDTCIEPTAFSTSNDQLGCVHTCPSDIDGDGVCDSIT